MGKPTVVVGVDGTHNSQRALIWAAREAKLRGAVLLVVHAWQYPFEALSNDYVPPTPDESEVELWADDVVNDAIQKLREEVNDLGDLEIKTRAINGTATQVLLEVCKEADLLVVGRHHKRLIADLFIGSTSQFLVSHALCPVVVVHDGTGSVAGSTPEAGDGTQQVSRHGDAGMPGKSILPGESTASEGDGNTSYTDLQEQTSQEATATNSSRGYLTELSENECIALLNSHSTGRLAVLEGNEPRIFVINYLLDGHTVAFRTDPGMKLEGASFHPVSLEIDELDEKTHAGWSVVVNGFGRDITEAVDEWSEEIRNRDLLPWVAGEKQHWVAIVNPTITGRRLPPATDV